jgi:hypothetical protein
MPVNSARQAMTLPKFVWCKTCGHRAEPNIADQVAHHGEAMTVIDWARRLRCSACGGRKVDFMVSGAAR